jgi:hypothetical protein
MIDNEGTRIEDVLTFMCGFRASDADIIGQEVERMLGEFKSAFPDEPVHEWIMGSAFLTAVDRHIASLPRKERNRLAPAVSKLSKAFCDAYGLEKV